MEDNEITLEEDEIKFIRSIVEDYLEESPGNRMKELVRKFSGIDETDLSRYRTLEEFCYDLINDINDSGKIKEFLEYMAEEHSPRSKGYYSILEKYIPETPEGTYLVTIPGIDESTNSVNPISELEPTIAQATYEKILQAIHDMGKNIEQHLKSFKNSSETELRDHLLSVLYAAFPDNAASGETFNKSGKTDIVLKRKNSNLFVAECKIWDGKSDLKKATNQILKYLTWRDSKAALIIFVNNKKFSYVLDQISKIMGEHPNHLSFVDKRDDTWFNFLFHIEGGPDKTLKLAVLCFHFS